MAEEQASFFTNAGIAFAAISSDELALQESISEGPPTLETGIELLPAQQTFLREFAVLSRELRPGVSDLRATLPVLNEAIEVGTPVLRDTTADQPAPARRVLTSLNRLISQPRTKVTLQRLEETFEAAEPLAEWVVPAQTVCNYWNYFCDLHPQALSDRDQVGYAFRQMLTEFPRLGRGPGTSDRLLRDPVQRPSLERGGRHLRAL